MNQYHVNQYHGFLLCVNLDGWLIHHPSSATFALGFFGNFLYLLAGLALAIEVLPLWLSEDFVRVGAEVGVLLLLFMLGAGVHG